MKCKDCGASNDNPVFEAVQMPVSLDVIKTPVIDAIPIRWACRKCGRYHFRDGSLYSGKEARTMVRNSGRKVPNLGVSEPDK